ncbi:hypothetical protein ACTFIR_009409 [Dictyostelium discoideum]
MNSKNKEYFNLCIYFKTFGVIKYEYIVCDLAKQLKPKLSLYSIENFIFCDETNTLYRSIFNVFTLKCDSFYEEKKNLLLDSYNNLKKPLEFKDDNKIENIDLDDFQQSLSFKNNNNCNDNENIITCSDSNIDIISKDDSKGNGGEINNKSTFITPNKHYLTLTPTVELKKNKSPKASPFISRKRKFTLSPTDPKRLPNNLIDLSTFFTPDKISRKVKSGTKKISLAVPFVKSEKDSKPKPKTKRRRRRNNIKGCNLNEIGIVEETIQLNLSQTIDTQLAVECPVNKDSSVRGSYILLSSVNDQEIPTFEPVDMNHMIYNDEENIPIKNVELFKKVYLSFL